jgi:transposase
MDSTAGPSPTDHLEPTAVAQSGAGLTPFDLQQVTLTRREHIELRHQLSSYRTLHGKAVSRMQRMQRTHDREIGVSRSRIAQLEAELDAAKAQIRDLRQRVFGSKTEHSRWVHVKTDGEPAAPTRPRGQQRGAAGHGRRRLESLPTREEHRVLGTQCCTDCGRPFQEIAGTHDAEVLEIEVKAYRRVVRRHRYRPACACGCGPGVVSAKLAPQLIPRGKLGVSIWVEALLSKYLYGQPTHRLLQDWADQGLEVAQGTLTDGLRCLAPMFAPLAQACLEELRKASHWHADETRWEVFEEREGKIGHRWYLWVFSSETVVSFVLDPSRSATVPLSALKGVGPGVLSVDRYAAYRKFARRTPGVELAICWAHQRRDFLRVANDHPRLWDWAMGWVGQIGQVYRLHAERRARAGDPADEAFVETDTKLRERLAAMRAQCDLELVDPQIAKPAAHVLRALSLYWPGLVRFVDHPLIGLDNNAAERLLRPAVVGRKNYYGSGSECSGALAATLMGLFATVRKWGLNPRTWLTRYLQACCEAGGRAPEQFDRFLPWTMSEAESAVMRAGPTIDTS